MTTTTATPPSSAHGTSLKRRHRSARGHGPGSKDDDDDESMQGADPKRQRRKHMKKRMKDKDIVPCMGATEFAAVLNSGTSDYNSLYRTLKNFVVIVRRERRIALEGKGGGGGDCLEEEEEESSFDDDDDEEEGSDEEEGEEVPSKRYKKAESWKQDTANYNVPFVGTSFAAVQDTGRTIIVGEWPTGLLKAYLKKSPLAVELTGDDNAFVPSSNDGGYSQLQKNVIRKQKASAATTSKRQRQQQEQLVQAIHKYYLKALVELISAAIPISSSSSHNEHETSIIKHDENDDKDDDDNTGSPASPLLTTTRKGHVRFLPELIKRRLPGLLHLLKLETGAGKGSITGTGIVTGGCGHLAAPVIHVLTALVQTTNPLAVRHVTRALELGTIVNDAILKFLLLVPRLRPCQHYHKSSTSLPAVTTAESSSVHSIPRNQARSAILQLAAALAARTDDDHTLVTSIITPGVKDRKIPPGILYLALREGLLLSSSSSTPTNSLGDSHHWHAVTKLLQVVRHLYLLGGDQSTATTTRSSSSHSSSSSNHNVNSKVVEMVKRRRRRGVIASPRALSDLWTRDAVQSLCVLSTQYAPPLSNNNNSSNSNNSNTTFFNVLDETDTLLSSSSSSHRLLLPHQQAGLQARRLLFTLLANPQSSPLLYDYNNAFVRTHCEQLVVRAMVLLLDGCSTNNNANSNGGNVLAMQNFLLYVVQTTPTVLPIFFREMQFPHMTAPGDDNTNLVFPIIARWNFVTKILVHGPSVMACIGNNNNNDNKRNSPPQVDVNCLYPVNIKKQHMRKALLSANAFLVAETLKLVIAALRRFHVMKLESSYQEHDEAEFTALTTAFCNVLPDVQCLRTILQRFGIGQEERFNHIIISRLCETFRLLAKALPHILHDAKLDWVKLFLVHSNNVAIFTNKTRISFQCNVLDSLHEILMATETAANLTSSSLQPILEIMIKTMNQGVMERARRIALFLLHPHRHATKSCYSEATSCLAHEASCWVDGMTLENVDEFIKVVQESASIPLRGMVDLARAWRAAGISSSEPIPVSTTAVSTILLAALLRVQHRRSSSPGFALLTFQVAIKCMLYHVDPRPLAALIIYRDADSSADLSEEQSPSDTGTDERFDKLSAYAKSLIHFESLSPSKRARLLDSVVDSLFGSSWKKSIEKDNSIASIRVLAHRIVVSPSNLDDECSLKLFRCKIAAIIKNSQFRLEIGSFMNHIYPRLRACCSTDDLYPLDILLLSCGMDDLAELPKNELDTTRLFSALQQSDPINGSTVDTRASLLYHILLGPFLPRLALNGCVTRLLSAPWKQLTATNVAASWSSLCVAFLKLVDGRFNKNIRLTDVSLAHVLWQAWFGLSIKSEPHVLVHIQSIIADAMSSGSASVFILNKSFELNPTRAIIHRAARIQATASRDGMTGHCLVSSLIQNDYIRFASSFVELVVDSNETDPLKEQLNEGMLDTVLLATLDRVYQSDDAEKQDFLVSLAGLVLGRALTIFEDTKADSKDMEDVTMMLLKLKLHTLERVNREQLEHVTKALHRSFSGSGAAVSVNQNSLLFRLALHLHHSINKGVEELASAAIVHLSQVTLRALQQTRKKSKRTESSPDPIEMSQLLCDFVRSISVFDHDIDIDHMRSTLLNLGRVCLKLGMKHGLSDEAPLQMSCLQLVRTLVIGSKASCPLQFLSISGNHSLANLVFDLCTSHSRFGSILNDDENRNNPMRLETVLLLLSCISGNHNVRFDSTTWETLLSAYGGGMDTVDKAIRRLLFLYAPTSETSETVFMHQIRWNLSSSRSSQTPWDWLASSLDMSRVYATLRRFPIEDLAEPTTIRGIEEWCHADERKGPPLLVESCSEPNDQRYSTGFVLPLILGAVEFVYEGLSGSDDDVQSGGRGSVVVLAQRLCDIGAIALALAGLCSTCPTMRKVSISILYLMTRVIQSDEARQLAPWRQRPQLSMILDAVQRALAIRKAEISFDSHHEEKVNPPQLPPTVAIFLSKASLVLHRPGHFMYPAINRFFLRIEADHGAFQDLNRLPGFISLFCSSSDEAGQAQKEQMWAVEVLRDSFLDETCYKGLMTCHAPELLLTTVDSLSCRAPSLRINESELLLSALLRIVSYGGHRATSHLIGRLGLLSWLQSFMVGRRAQIIIPSPRGRMLFLRLVKETVQHAIGFLSTDDLQAACSGMGQAVISMFLDSVGQDVTRDDSLAEQTCDVLRVILESCGGWKQLMSEDQARPDGIAIQSASRFLSIAGGAKQLSDLIISICSLPVCMEALSSDMAISFCTMVLGILEDVENPDEALLTTVFKRLHFILSDLPIDTVDDKVLQASILSQHASCCRYMAVRQMWQKCAGLIHPSFEQPSDDLPLL